MDEEFIKRILRWISWPAMGVAMILGIYGYVVAGYHPADAVYSAFSLFGFAMEDVQKNIWLEISRWLAPASGLTTVFVEAAPLFKWVEDRVVFFIIGKRTVVYSDSEAGRGLLLNMNGKALLWESGSPFKWETMAKRAVIMMKDDEVGLDIYRRLNKSKTMDVYLCLQDMEPNLIPSSGKTKIFNVNDLIAGDFWKNELSFCDLDKYGTESVFKDVSDARVDIVIIGYGGLGKRILYKALLLNLFSLEQKIVYHVIDVGQSRVGSYKDVKRATENGDEVLFYRGFDEGKAVLKLADYIIITYDMPPGDIQDILYSYKEKQSRIYYYDPEGVKLEDIFLAPNTSRNGDSMAYAVKTDASTKLYERLYGFGKQENVVTEKKIFKNKFDSIAAWLNADYLRKRDFKEVDELAEWEKLSGFYKGSNINEVDFAEVGNKIRSWGRLSDEELAELVHIHWCRYHRLNHWNYAPGEKNVAELTHPDLVAYSDLDESKKENDRDLVKKWSEIDRRLNPQKI